MEARNWKMTETGEVAPWEPAMNWTSGMVVAARKNTNPVPGQPSGNVEKSLCTRGPVLSLAARLKSRNPEKLIPWTPLSRGLLTAGDQSSETSDALKVDDSALQPYGDGVCPIIGAEFRKDILDVTLHCLFRNGKLAGDLLVGIST